MLPIPDPLGFAFYPPSSPSDHSEKELKEPMKKLIDRALFGGRSIGIPDRKSDKTPLERELQSPELTERVLQRFKQTLKSPDSGAVLRATAHGSSGYTLMGHGPVKAFIAPSALAYTTAYASAYASAYAAASASAYASAYAAASLSPAAAQQEPEKQEGIVLKWVLQRAANDEYACNELAKAFGLNVPVMQAVSKETSALFVSPTKRAKPSFAEGPFQLIAMNRIDGMNLSQLCMTGDIFSLSKSSWKQMMYEFGRAAILDLFSGNFDRFLRFQMNEKGVFELAEEPEANAGNVMVHTTPERRNIASMSFIDNTSLAPPSKTEPAAEEPIGLSLFELGESGPAPTTPPRTPPIKEEDPKIVKELNAFFVSTCKELQKDSGQLAVHVSSALKNAILSSIKEKVDLVAPEKLQAVHEALKTSHKDLKEGLIDGLIRLKNPRFQEQALAAVKSGSRSLNELVGLNLCSINESEFDLSQSDDLKKPVEEATPPLETLSVSVNFSPSETALREEPPKDLRLISTSCGSVVSLDSA